MRATDADGFPCEAPLNTCIPKSGFVTLAIPAGLLETVGLGLGSGADSNWGFQTDTGREENSDVNFVERLDLAVVVSNILRAGGTPSAE